MKALLFAIAISMSARAAAPVNTLATFPNSMVYAVQTDTTGNIYVAGFQGNFAKADPFVAKLSPTGQTLYLTTFAGSNFGIAWAIAVDSSGAAYVFGNTDSPDFPVTQGALQTTMQGAFQGFVAKLDPAGKIVYSTFIGGATNVTPGLTSAPGLDSILVDSAGDVIITGQAGANSTLPAFPPRQPSPWMGRGRLRDRYDQFTGLSHYDKCVRTAVHCQRHTECELLFQPTLRQSATCQWIPDRSESHRHGPDLLQLFQRDADG